MNVGLEDVDRREVMCLDCAESAENLGEHLEMISETDIECYGSDARCDVCFDLLFDPE